MKKIFILLFTLTTLLMTFLFISCSDSSANITDKVMPSDSTTSVTGNTPNVTTLQGKTTTSVITTTATTTTVIITTNAPVTSGEPKICYNTEWDGKTLKGFQQLWTGGVINFRDRYFING